MFHVDPFWHVVGRPVADFFDLFLVRACRELLSNETRCRSTNGVGDLPLRKRKTRQRFKICQSRSCRSSMHRWSPNGPVLFVRKNFPDSIWGCGTDEFFHHLHLCLTPVFFISRAGPSGKWNSSGYGSSAARWRVPSFAQAIETPNAHPQPSNRSPEQVDRPLHHDLGDRCLELPRWRA